MPFTFKAILNNKPNQDGTYSILIRVTCDRVRRFVNTGERVKKSEFNGPKGEVRKSNVFAGSINSSIGDKIQAAQEKIRESPGITLHLVQDFMKGKEIKETPRLLSDMALELTQIYYANDAILTRYYKASIGHWQAFEKHSKKEYLPAEVDIKVLKDFENFLLTKTKSKSQSTAAKHLTRIRRIFKLSVAHGFIGYTDNPFINYELKHGKTAKKERLSLTEIAVFEALELKEGSDLFHARNIWLAQMYCAGARIGDMITMRVGNISNGRLIYDMSKTEEQSSVQIPKRALPIFEYYCRGKKPGEYIFPFFQNGTDYTERDFRRKQIQSKTTMINYRLKKLAVMIGTEKNLSTHVARHTFADMARQKSKDIYGVSKALRHSSTKITEQYLASFDNDAVDEIMGSVFD